MFNKKIVLSILTLTMLAALGSAGTWAYFQDQATGTGYVVAGTVDLKAGTSDSLGNIYLPNLVPGDYGTMNLGKVDNKGTAPGELYLTVTHTDGTAVDPSLKLYFVANGITKTVNLADGAANVDLGPMAAGGSMPMGLYFEYTNLDAVQTGANHVYGITLNLRSAGENFGNINVANDWFATHPRAVV